MKHGFDSRWGYMRLSEKGKIQNRAFNADHKAQGEYKRVLCVCSAGLLRSPTAALVLSQEPFNHNTRAAGIEETYALVVVDEVLVRWADEIVCMTREHRDKLVERFAGKGAVGRGAIKVLGIADDYDYRDPELMRLIATRYNEN